MYRLLAITALSSLQITASFAELPQEAYDHWAWKPIVAPAPPPEIIQGWTHPIDRFIAKKLAAANLAPSPPASAPHLIRRLKFDLLALPVTFEESQKYVREQNFAEMIDSYLSRPEYGERWGRHWLDVARYSDTAGEVPETQEARYPFAYTYRDYVIQAFNEDRPFNQFIIDQIAADLLPTRKSDKDLAALGFLTVGDRRLNRRHEIIDDRIDVITRGTMALTVACSRCHDHKYDPIPTADYYSLYGVLDSTHEPAELPVIGKAPNQKDFEAFKKKLNELTKTRDDQIADLAVKARADVRSKSGAYMSRANDPEYKKKELALRRGQVKRWEVTLRRPPPSLESILAPARAAYHKKGDALSKAVATRLAAKQKPVNPIIAQRLQNLSPATFPELAKRYQGTFDEALKRWADLRKTEPSATALKDPNWEAIRQALFHAESPIPHTDEQARKIFGQSEAGKVKAKQKAIDRFIATSAGAPPRAMVLHDTKAKQPVIFKRGDPNNRGDNVPRQFPAIAAGTERKPFQHGSGRLEMAQAIASPTNPLTARTIVNRVWHWHFGRGLVGTVDNFGVLGDKPTHPELLDYLANAFIKNGWSVKWLHRHILSSKTYQQASSLRADANEKDPENRLLWRFSRKRLEFEALRDAVLASSGTLSTKRGGRPFELTKKPYDTRRTVYAFIDRSDLPQALTVFDFASPSASTGIRPDTTVPQQALFMLNGDFMLTQSQTLAMSDAAKKIPAGPQRIRYLFTRILAREPSKTELQSCLAFCKSWKPGAGLGAYVQLAQTLMCSNEFTFVD